MAVASNVSTVGAKSTEARSTFDLGEQGPGLGPGPLGLGSAGLWPSAWGLGPKLSGLKHCSSKIQTKDSFPRSCIKP